MDDYEDDYPDNAPPAEAPAAATLSPLQQASAYLAPLKLPDAPPSPVDPSAKWNAFAAGALKPTSSGRFSESLSNALGGYTDAQQREAELQARYLPILYDAKLKRAEAQQRMQQQQMTMMQGWGKAMTGSMASLLELPTITKQDAIMAARGAVQQGSVPAQFATQYIKELPDDPVELKAYIHRSALAMADPFRALAKPTYQNIRPNGTLAVMGPDGQVLRTVQGSAPDTELARLIKERAALPPGSPLRAEYDAKINKETTHQPAQSTVIMPPEKPLVNAFMEQLGKSLENAREVATGGAQTINTVHRLRDALSTGQVMAGPGTTAKMVLGQIGSSMGINGKDTNEKITNTRAAISSLAQLELDASAQMRGQGAITENERLLLKRAASGDVDGMTVPELRVLANVVERSARYKINNYNIQGRRMLELKDPHSGKKIFENMPEGMLTVQEPPSYGARPVIRYDANGNPVQ